jgi:hypothetical protein
LALKVVTYLEALFLSYWCDWKEPRKTPSD